MFKNGCLSRTFRTQQKPYFTCRYPVRRITVIVKAIKQEVGLIDCLLRRVQLTKVQFPKWWRFKLRHDLTLPWLSTGRHRRDH